MSLINDALKKAQRQRTGDHGPLSQPPMPGGGPVPAGPVRAGGGSNPQLLLVGAGALLGLVIAGGGVFFFRDHKSASAPPSVPAVESAAPAKVAVEPPATVSAPPPPGPGQRTEPAVATKTESSPTSALTATPPVVAIESTTTKPQASEPPAPSLRMIEAIEALRVAGIRSSASGDAKVLMNDRVYRLGDTVDHALGIKLTGVTASSLTFRDASGATYTRNF